MDINIIDILFSISIISYIMANTKQLIRLVKIKDSIAISLTKSHIKTFGSICGVIAYVLSGLFLSIVISLISLIINLIEIKLVTKYRGLKFWSY